MNQNELKILLSELRSLPNETEWVEFKASNGFKIGEYISSLSNSACIHDKDFGYIVFGIDDKTHRIVGTSFSKSKKVKGNEDLIPWLARLLEPRINFDFHEFEVDGKNVAIVKIKATQNTPVKFKGVSYIRIGSYNKKLDDFPEKERSIWTKTPRESFEKEIAVHNLNADEVLKIIDYSSYFELTNSPLPENRDAIFERFIQ